MKVQVNISRKKAMGIMHNAQSMEQALKVIRHEHSNYDATLRVQNWDQTRREFAVALAVVFKADAKVAAKFYQIMKEA